MPSVACFLLIPGSRGQMRTGPRESGDAARTLGILLVASRMPPRRKTSFDKFFEAQMKDPKFASLSSP